MIILKYFKREHRGGLKESLATQKYISLEQFNKLLDTNKYHFYGYDERVFQYLFILKDMQKDYKNYTTWIGIEAIDQLSLFESLNIKK